MDTPKTLAARLRVAARRPGQDNPICIVTVADAKAAADYLDRLPAPDVGVGLTREQRHRIEVEIGEVSVRLLGEIIELVTHREDEPTWGNKIATLIHDELFPREAALAASTARENAKDAEIAGLREALDEAASDMERIASNIDHGISLKLVLIDLNAAKGRARTSFAALSGRKPDTKEGT